MSRFEADIALARSNVRRMPSAADLARYQADAREAARRSGAVTDNTASRLRAFIFAMTAPNSTSLGR